MSQTTVNGKEIIQTRQIKSPRHLVFDAFVNPEKIVHWWGPDGFTITTEEINIAVGGRWKFIMHGPDGADYLNLITYSKIDPPSELRFRVTGGEADDPNGFDTILTFEEKDGGTLLTMKSILKDKEAVKYVVENHNALEGGRQTLNKLEAFLATDHGA